MARSVASGCGGSILTQGKKRLCSARIMTYFVRECLFNDTVCKSNYIVSVDKMINE
jgi:hypothetical protein